MGSGLNIQQCSCRVHYLVPGQAPLPQIELLSPTNNSIVDLPLEPEQRNLQLIARTVSPDPGISILRVSFYDSFGDDEPRLIGTTTETNLAPDTYTCTWRTPPAGWHRITAYALDSAGQENLGGAYVEGQQITSMGALIYIAGNSNNLPPIAQITNLTATITNDLNARVYPVVTNGFIDIHGVAQDSDTNGTLSYMLSLFKPDGTLIVNLTPNPGTNGYRSGGDIAGVLATNVDLSLFENGVYDIQLDVFDGWEISSDTARILLDTQLKIGQFSFSVQDVVLPVGGMPLTVLRTYNSLNRKEGDFGYSWTYAINDVNLELDEERRFTPDLDGGERFSLRVGGGRDVTLTLPDGRRTTFQFYYGECQDCGDFGGYGEYCYPALWQAAPGVDYTLTTTIANDGVILTNVFNALTGYWNNQAGTGFENYDFAGFALIARDGTKYIITREDEDAHFFLPSDAYDEDHNDHYFAHTYGPARLRKIIQPDNNRIQIERDVVQHYDPQGNTTRAIRFRRDERNRITDIWDPNSGTNGLPVIRYLYDTNHNLAVVKKLIDRQANGGEGHYESTYYQYTNSVFPHYLTGIVDPRAVQVARSEYDDDARLTAVVDADGKRTEFRHELDSKIEIIIDRLGHTNTYVYDVRGNVTASTNTLGGITLMAYDRNNNKTNEVVFLDQQPYATNRYVYSPDNLLLVSYDPLGRSNVFTYNSRGQVLTTLSSCGCGYGSTNVYDDGTGNLIATSDALGHWSSNYYNGAGLLAGTRNAIGTLTTNSYDELGNLAGTATIESDGITILSTNSFAYDPNGNQTESVVWRQINGIWVGATNTYVYDAQNRVVHTINPEGFTSTVVFNTVGKQAAAIDVLGRTNSYEYDAQGRLFRTTYPDLATEISYYDAEGRRTNSVDRAGRLTSYVYDALGRLWQTVYADNTTNRTEYDDLGRVRFSVDARGVTNAFGYDAAGQRVAVTNALGAAEETWSLYGYDLNGNQVTFTNALGRVTTSVYDPLNRRIELQYADGTTSSTGYDDVGRRVAETNQDNVVTWFGYDGAGRLVSVTNAVGTTNEMVTRYEYDEAGNQIAQVDALNRTTWFEFDSMGRRIARTLPGVQSESFAYDPAGNLIEHQKFDGLVITNAYDVMNRLWKRCNGSTLLETYAYDAVSGQLTNRVDSSGSYSWVYDIRGRVRTNSTPVGVLYYDYDINGNLTNLCSYTPNGVSIAYEYDSLNRLTNVIDNRLTGTRNTAYTFDQVGNLQTMRYPCGVTNLYEYDALNRLTNLTWKCNGDDRAEFSYELGRSGNRTNLQETVNGTSRGYAWTYDKLSRLTSETIQGAAPVGTLGYVFDQVGNRLNRTGDLGLLGPQTSSFDVNDWLDDDSVTNNGSAWFDDNGNTRTNGPCQYGYDWADRLIGFTNGATNVTIEYDATGNRVSKTVGGTTTLYLVDTLNPSGYAQVLEEFTVTGSATNLSMVYTYGLDLISQRVPGVSTHFLGYDGHGSTRLLLSSAGAVVESYAYDAYGTLIDGPASPLTAYLYCGEQWDSDIGQYYLRARYLNPGQGRFLTMDAFEGNQSDPLSLHKYLYAEDNPIGNADPNGREIESILTLTSVLMNFIIPVKQASTYIGLSGPDVTDWLKAESKKNANSPEAKKIARLNTASLVNPTMRAIAYQQWKNMVGYEKPWDFKTFLEPNSPDTPRIGRCPTQRCAGFLNICGVCQRYDVVANFHFGYVGRAAKFFLNELLGGASLAQFLHDRTLDPEHDREAIKAGWEAYSSGDVCGALRSKKLVQAPFGCAPCSSKWSRKEVK